MLIKKETAVGIAIGAAAAVLAIKVTNNVIANFEYRLKRLVEDEVEKECNRCYELRKIDDYEGDV